MGEESQVMCKVQVLVSHLSVLVVIKALLMVMSPFYYLQIIDANGDLSSMFEKYREQEDIIMGRKAVS